MTEKNVEIMIKNTERQDGEEMVAIISELNEEERVALLMFLRGCNFAKQYKKEAQPA